MNICFLVPQGKKNVQLVIVVIRIEDRSVNVPGTVIATYRYSANMSKDVWGFLLL